VIYVYSIDPKTRQSKLNTALRINLLQVYRFAMSEKHIAVASFSSVLKTLLITDGATSQDQIKKKDVQPLSFTAKKHLELKGHSKGLNWVSLNPDEEKVTSVGLDGTLKIFSCQLKSSEFKDSDYLLIDKKVDRIVPDLNVSQFKRILYCNKNTIVALSEDERTLIFMEGKTAKAVCVIKNTTQSGTRITSWAASSDGKHLFTGGEDNVVRMWAVPN